MAWWVVLPLLGLPLLLLLLLLLLYLPLASARPSALALMEVALAVEQRWDSCLIEGSEFYFLF